MREMLTKQSIAGEKKECGRYRLQEKGESVEDNNITIRYRRK